MLALTPAACGDDSTGPEPATDIAVAVLELDGPAISQEVGGEPRIRCDVTFRATATGTGRANWQDATIRFFVGPDRSRPVDSIFIPATEIHAAWVDTGMDAGTTDESRWYFESGAPFAISADFRYRPSSSGTTVKTANVSFEVTTVANAAPQWQWQRDRYGRRYDRRYNRRQRIFSRVVRYGRRLYRETYLVTYRSNGRYDTRLINRTRIS